MRIEINKVRCRHCQEVVESTNEQAPPVFCKCKKVGVAGGLKALKRTSNFYFEYEELSEYEYDNPKDVEWM